MTPRARSRKGAKTGGPRAGAAGGATSGLEEYHHKRDFGITPEPKGRVEAGAGRSYCIQKHAATRLHYDFRLELDGVLKSWAVPKGPSLDPADKRLAMQTEDHPVDYGDFEGIIPEGEYGGGTVVLWDRGTWEPIEDVQKSFRTGRLKFRLFGEKLTGAWMLVRTKPREGRDDGRTWLLFKERDAIARPAAEYSIVDDRPESVATGRTLEQVAKDKDRVWHSNRVDEVAERAPAKARTFKARMAQAARTSRARPAPVESTSIPGARRAALAKAPPKPQLATLVSEAPDGNEWVHELKFDGYRILARLEDGRVRLFSRNAKEWTGVSSAIEEALADLPAASALLDGELAVLLPDGTTSFQALQNAAAAGGTLVYFAFDLLHLDGADLRGAALVDRKAALETLLKGAPPLLRYSQHVEGSGAAFFAQACRHRLEGIISKRRDARYAEGRGRTWLKVKCHQEQELVVGGWTDPSGARVGLGALLLGVNDGEGRLVYAGKVGTGFDRAKLQDLQKRLARLARPTSPFAGKIEGERRAHWVEPTLVAQVAFTEWTSDGRLRHPSFQGLREDKRAADVVREVPATPPKDDAAPRAAPARMRKTAAEVAGVRLTNPDRVLYPEQGTTKRDLALFYESIARAVLPHVEGRPLTLVRCPEGREKGCFYMKHSGAWAPPALRRVEIQEKTKVGDYLVVESLAGLVSLVQIGILEIHAWNSRADAVEEPDRIVLDFDPGPSVSFARVKDAAQRVRALLEDDGLTSFVKTTGGKGLHVVVPLAPGHGWEETLAFSRRVAERMERDEPRLYTTSMPKAGRQDKILVDYLRNNRASTSVAAFSTRARPGAPVSVPLAWDELAALKSSDAYTIANVPARLKGLKKDPWARYGSLRQKLG